MTPREEKVREDNDGAMAGMMTRGRQERQQRAAETEKRVKLQPQRFQGSDRQVR